MIDTSTAIRVAGLSMSYRRGLLRRSYPALHSLDLEVGRGSVFGLLGPNGAGKTTLVKVLLGLAVGWRGHAEVLGQRAGTTGSRQRVGYLPEGHRLPNYLTGRQVLDLFGRMCGHNRSFLKERIPAWLERVDMTANADRKLREYSKGMQQRIGLAQALIHEPDVVFLDEPTDGVDPVGRAAIRRVIAELRDTGTTIFLNSHLLLEVEAMCDRVVILHKGQILREGSLEELTPRTGEVTFEISPVPDDLQTLLSGLGADFESSASGFSLKASQEEADRATDLLRSRSIAIRQITRRRLSLEESFIDLVGDGRATTKSAASGGQSS